MSKKSKSQYELQYNMKTQRWGKSIKKPNGKWTKLWFSSRCEENPTTYAAAYARYQAKLAEYEAERQRLEAEQAEASPYRQLAATLLKIDRGEATLEDLGTSRLAQQLRRGLESPPSDAELKQREERHLKRVEVLGLSEALERTREERARAGEYTAPTGEVRNVRQLREAWLADQRDRLMRRDLKPSGVKNKEYGTQSFEKFAGDRLIGDVDKLNRVLMGYVAREEARLADGKIKPHTFNDRKKFVRQLINWGYEHSYLEHLPRAITSKTLMKTAAVTKGGKPFTDAEVQQLWGAADERWRCYIALGLNCAFKNDDIATLTPDMLTAKKGRLVGRRNKATANQQGVPMNYKLWPVTLKLIKQVRADKDGRVFENFSGKGPLTTGQIAANFKKLAKKAGVADGQFSRFKDTGVHVLEDGIDKKGMDMYYSQVYQAHRDSTTRSYYTSDDPAKLKTQTLDQLTDSVEQHFQLTHP